MTHFAWSFPPFVTTAWPTAHVPMRSHSSWIVGPPRWRIAPATPEPSCRASFAGLTTASTGSGVMSDLTMLERDSHRSERPFAVYRSRVPTMASAIRM